MVKVVGVSGEWLRSVRLSGEATVSDMTRPALRKPGPAQPSPGPKVKLLDSKSHIFCQIIKHSNLNLHHNNKISDDGVKDKSFTTYILYIGPIVPGVAAVNQVSIAHSIGCFLVFEIMYRVSSNCFLHPFEINMTKLSFC